MCLEKTRGVIPMSEEFSSLYKRDTYLNKDIPFIYGSDIYEYDMHHAGISICKYFNLLPESEIERIETKSKNKKQIAVILGKLQRSNPEFKKNLAQGFIDAREMFFRENKLQDEDILSIKKDAIFTLRTCEHTAFEDIQFSLKNHYSSFVYTGLYEFYYAYDKLDVKGIDDRNLYMFKDNIMQFISKVFYKMENGSKEDILRYIRVFSDRYKRLELEPEYYRSFNREGNYRSKDGEYIYNMATPELLPEIDISFNYLNVILPLLKTII